MSEQLEFPIPPPVRLSGSPLTIHASLGRARIDVEEPPDDPPKPPGPSSWLEFLVHPNVSSVIIRILNSIDPSVFFRKPITCIQNLSRTKAPGR